MNIDPGTHIGLEAAAQVEALAGLAQGIRDVPAHEVPAWAAARAATILGAEVSVQPVTVLIPAPTPAPSPEPSSDAAPDPTICLTMPLVVDGEPWGDLHAVRRPSEGGGRNFSAHDQAAAAVIACLVVSALEKAALLRSSNRDPLTGLANRRALDDAAGTLLARVTLGSTRRVTAVCVGTSDPERVTEVATLLMRSFSPLAGSLVARVGETDFTVLIADHPVADVAAAADSFSAAAEDSPTAPEVFCGLASTAGTQPWETSGHLLAAARKACERARRERGITLPGRQLASS
jgi:GGDEF domain-containing protein